MEKGKARERLAAEVAEKGNGSGARLKAAATKARAKDD